MNCLMTEIGSMEGDLLVIVEYCRFGNLQTFLLKNRKVFINLVDDLGNLINNFTTNGVIKKIKVPGYYFVPISCKEDKMAEDFVRYLS